MGIRVDRVKQRLIDIAGIIASSILGSILLIYGLAIYAYILENPGELDMDYVKCYEIQKNRMVMACYGRYIEWYDFREKPYFYVDKEGVRYSMHQ